MKSLRHLYTLVVLLAIGALAELSSATTYTVLYAFSGTPDGGGPFYRLVLDTKGNVYGTTSGGGEYGGGAVFELSLVGGTWMETILHSFCPDWPHCSDGGPITGLALDAAGNLYGTTLSVFQLAPRPGGWNFKVIYNAGSAGDMIVDGAGNLYGAIGLGKCNGGEILELKLPSGTGDWIPKDLYDFCPNGLRWPKGLGPNYGLSWDAAGNLYGVTSAGGKENFGVVFQLEHTPSGWKEHVLHNFRGNRDGFYPYGGVVVDNLGNVYGSTLQGGSNRCGGPGCGTIYRLTRQPDGHWQETVLYRFPKLTNGAGPTGTLALDAAGNLYGVAGGGTGPCGGGGCGVVFKLAYNPDDTWTYTVLHRFKGSDGALPTAGVILDPKGNIYGTTSTGGKGGYGVVFKITR